MNVFLRDANQLSYNELIVGIKGKYCIRAIIGFGSYFLKKDAPYGDIDILVVVNNDVYHKYFTIVKGDLYDVTVINTHVVRSKISKLHQFFLRSFHESVILFDDDGSAAKLKDYATEKFCSPMPKLLRSNSLMLIRSRVRTLLLDMKENINNKIIFDLTFSSLVFSLRDAVCLINNYWATTYAKNALKEISIYEPAAAEMLESVFAQNSYDIKYEIASKIALTILQPVGGLLKQDEVISL